MRHTALLAFALVCSCSALVEIDDDKYLAGIRDGDGDDDPMNMGGGDGDGDAPAGDGDGNGDGDGDDSSGGQGLGGTGSGGSGGGDDTGGSGGSDVTGGTGGSNVTGGAGGSDVTGGAGGSDVTGGAPGSGGMPIEIPEPDHYYSLDGNVEDGGSGTPLPGAATGSVTWYSSTGLRGGALELPTNANAYLSFDPLVAGASPFTISWWFISAVDGYITLASRFPTEQGNGSWEFVADPSSPRIRIGNEEVFFEASFPSASLGQWTHVAVGYQEMFSGNQDRIKIWVNGEPVIEEARVFVQSALSTDAQVRIGQGGNGTQPFSGLLDEIRVYSAYLSNDEVHALYLFDAPPP